MTSLGNILKEKREKLGYTLNDIHEKTGIQLRYLEAIENNQLDIIPGDYYKKNFVVQYASVVKMDGEKLLEENKRQAELAEKERLKKEQAMKMNKPKKIAPVSPKPVTAATPEQKKNRKPVIIFCAIALAIVASLIYFSPKLFQQSVEITTTTTTTAASITTTSTASTTSTTTTTTTESTTTTTETTQSSTANNSGVSQNTVAPGGSNLVVQSSTANQIVYGLGDAFKNYKGDYNLTIKVTEPTWVRVSVHGKVILERTITDKVPTTIRALNNANDVTITFGISQAATLTLNGQNVAVPTTSRVETVKINLAK
ncbi:DUF4115 domain-containing protein [Carnobacteriaceae bacterium zg-ZUI78]|nr:DUF4115 domain-containing protein [Carnobacteriaceae bacterium zg-ZUI78]